MRTAVRWAILFAMAVPGTATVGAGVTDGEIAVSADTTPAHDLSAVLDSAVPDPEGPGVAVVLRAGGRELFAGARGVADLESRRPLRVETPVYVASVAKPVTAALVALEVERGALSLDDTLGLHLAEMGPMGSARIRHLLDHTSGIPDYFRWIEWPSLRRLDDAAVLDTLRAHPELEFPPGHRFRYSNSNYVLLSEVVRRAGGRDLWTAARIALVEPLALDDFWIDAGDDPPPADAAAGYVPEDDGFRFSSYEALDVPGAGFRARFDFATTGAGGLYASARDLARFGEAVAAGRIPGLPDPDRTPVPVPGDDESTVGEVRGYRGGWYVSELDGERVVWHDGNRGGFRAVLALAPGRGSVVAVVANRSDANVEAIATRILRESRGPG